MKLATVKETQP